jgi:hypothetical protein
MTTTTQQISFEGEGALAVKGQLIEPGALSWDLTDKMFIMKGRNLTVDGIIGRVTDIVREKDGTILATLDWDEGVEPKVVTIYAKGVEWDEEKAKRKGLQWVATKAHIRYVFVPDSDYDIPWNAENKS